MARCDTHYLCIPGGISWHFAIIVEEKQGWATLLFGQTQAHQGASETISPADASAAQFGGRITHPTHFHENNLAFIPVANLPQTKLGQLAATELPKFLKVAKAGALKYKQIRERLAQCAEQCECQGGCKNHEGRCQTSFNASAPRALMDWQMTIKNAVFCRPCMG